MLRAAFAALAVSLSALGSLASCGGGGDVHVPPGSLDGPADFAVRGRWPVAPRITYAVENEGGAIDGEAFGRAVARAADAWTTSGVVTLLPAAPGESVDVTLGWRRGHHGACQPFGPGADVAHAGPVRPGTFVHFDLGREWSEDGERGVSVFHTALHELGHVLGLGHSEAPESVMGTDARRPAGLSAHDLAGLWSLYGGGEDGPGDLRVQRADGSVAVVLRRVAPPDRCGFAVFDTDGDGRDEVLVWRTDRAGGGAMVAYRFSERLELEGTRGPFPGVVVAGAEVGFVDGGDGVRLVVSRARAGPSAEERAVVRQFDSFGVSGQVRVVVAPELLMRARAARDGDLDGDGSPEAAGFAGS